MTLELRFLPADGLNKTGLHAELSRATPWAVYPASVLSGLVGALAGWLVFGWASRRLEGQNILWYAMAIVTYVVAMFFWWLPILLGVPLSIAHHLNEPHPRWHPLWEWLGQPFASALYLLGCTSALLGIAIAALPRRRVGVAAKTQAPA